MRKWMIGMTMALMVSMVAGQALAEDAADAVAGADTAQVDTVPAQASAQGKAHAQHGKKKGHDKHHAHGKGHKKS